MEDRSRIDIKMRNVFISWTGRDCALKDRIVQRLVAGKITCTVSDGKSSDGRCSGNFVQWSADAAKSANVFLLVLTENTLKSAYVPLEIKEFLNIEDAENRMIVVCPSLALWQSAVFEYGGEKIKLSERNISITEMPDCNLTDEILDDIYAKTADLINNRAYKVYQQELKPKYIDILSLYSDDAPDRKIRFDDLYINRHVTEKDNLGNVTATHSTPEQLVKSDDVFYICGPAGSGKTQYIHQLQNSVGEDSLIITLSCSKIATSTATLREQMFDKFCRVLGNPVYFTEDNFVNLLNNRRLVLVLDGLDEIASQSGVRTFIKKVEEEYYARHNADTTLFITGRDEKSANRIALTGKTLRILHLEQLTDEETHTLSNNLFLSFGTSVSSDGFFVRIKDLQDEIKYNPLLLSQLAVIYKENGDVPHTVVGIFDAISKITLNIDAGKHYTSIPERYMDMIEQISPLLKRFAQKRYILQSNDEHCTPQEIFEEILFNDYKDDYSERAAFLVEFLVKRSILVDDGNSFYHKMFLEYFTAVYYYERSILRRSVADYDVFNELFAHYADPYWEQVITLFLIKADSLMNGEQTRSLYAEVLKAANVSDYTLLFDNIDNLTNKQAVAITLIADILAKSANKTYPPYGPLFWYVPHYSLYEETLLALATLGGNAAALAIARDVCYIYGQKNRLTDLTDKVDGKALLDSAVGLTGVRRALCEIFYTGDTDCTGGTDIYPRCFNVAETLSFRDNSCGVGGIMSTPFDDELGLYSHESYNELNGEYMGFVSCPYTLSYVENKLREKATRRVTGIAYSATNTEYDEFHSPRFFDETSVCYYPENMDGKTSNSRLNSKRMLYSASNTDVGIFYLHGDIAHPYSTDSSVKEHMYDSCYRLSKVKLPDSITEIQDGAFEASGLTEINLPAGLTKLGKQAFRNCRNLTSIVIPQGVSELCEEVFSGCESLERVTLPYGLRIIGDYAFSGCQALREVIIPDTVTEIGQSAFGGCESLKTVTIPNGVSQISKHCFEDCISLEQITLPQGILKMGTGAFNNCSKLQSIHAPHVTTVEKKLFCHCTALKEVQLGALTAIGDEAFAGCENVSHLKFADSMTEIGERAFESCAFTTVVIPHGIKAIAPYTFSNCAHLTAVTIPDTVTEIGRNAFEACPIKRIDIPASVVYIGIMAFSNCTSLSSVDMKMGLKTIDNLAFENCESLRELVIPDTVEELGKCMCYNAGITKVRLSESLMYLPEGVFSGCSSLIEINMPAKINMIMSAAFQDCTSLETINLESVGSIFSEAFCNCKSLKTVGTTANLTGLGYATFRDCVNLQEIDVSSVHDVYKYAFAGCSQLRKIQLGEKLTKIHDYAFANCVKLEQIDLCENVTDVDSTAFDGCSGLKSITAPLELKNEVSKWNLPKDCNVSYTQRESEQPDTVVVVVPEGTTEITKDMIPKNATRVVLPNGVETIDAFAFAECRYLTEVNIPWGVKVIHWSAFADCISLTKLNMPDTVEFIINGAFSGCSNLQEIYLSNNVTGIGEGAFAGCSKLQEIYIPDSVTYIDENAFAGCEALTKIRLPKHLDSISKNMFRDCCSFTELVVPEGVTKIGEGAFEQCKLDKIVLPSTLIKFDERAFYKTEIAQGVTIPQGVTEIADETFRESSIPHVTLPHGLQRIGKSAFISCKITEINIPETVKTIGEFAFVHCEELKEVNISQGITCIEYGAFSNCTSLQSVHLPDTLHSIQDNAFGGCTSLTEIAIPDSVTTLGSFMLPIEKDEYLYKNLHLSAYNQGVFEKCINLQKVHLPKGITVITERAFYGCTSLGDIEIPQSVTLVKSLAFAHCNIKSVTILSPFISIAEDAFAETSIETLTISRNFEQHIDSICGKNLPKKIVYI